MYVYVYTYICKDTYIHTHLYVHIQCMVEAHLQYDSVVSHKRESWLTRVSHVAYLYTQTEILKSQLTTKLTVLNEIRADS